MKKITAITIVLLCVLSTSAQIMPSVAGVTFGQSYDRCKSILDSKYNNGGASYQITANKLRYNDLRFGGSYFDYVDFDFQSTCGLCMIKFVSRFNLSESTYAKAQRDALLNTFREKYELRWDGTNDDGYRYYVLGHNPKKPDDGFVVIETYKGPSNSGKLFLWTTVTYGPVYTVDVKDEI